MKTLAIFFFTFFLYSNSLLFAQSQLGEDIDGEAANHKSGEIVALSEDGNIVAIAGRESGLGYSVGKVRIFNWTNEQWTQMGNNIDNLNGNFYNYGADAMAISGDGNIVAIGKTSALNNMGVNSGIAFVFEFINNEWVQKGEFISGDGFLDNFGASIALSNDGNIVAIGGERNNDIASCSGKAKVFQWVDNQWLQIGNDVYGEAQTDFFGTSVDLSSDGSILAVGAPGNDENGNNAGMAKAFQLQGNNWAHIGSSLYGNETGSSFGYSVSLSTDGYSLAVGAPSSSSGQVSSYQLTGNNWVQKGNTINGENDGDRSGYSVSLSNDGNIMAVGAYENDGNGTGSGHTRIFEFEDDQWAQLGNDIDGEAAYDKSGISVSLAGNGSKLAIGAYWNDGNGASAGHTRIFNISKPNIVSDDLCFVIDHNPDLNNYILEGDFTNCSIFVLDENENVVQFLLNIFDKIIIDLDELPAGQHFIRVEHQQYANLFYQNIIKQ